MLDFQVAGRRMFQSPGGLLLILYVRSHCTQESFGRNPCEILVWGASAPGRCAPGLDIVISVALKASFLRQKRQCPAPAGRAEAHKRKKHSGLLCFLVAGRRIELRTS